MLSQFDGVEVFPEYADLPKLTQIVCITYNGEAPVFEENFPVTIGFALRLLYFYFYFGSGVPWITFLKACKAQNWVWRVDIDSVLNLIHNYSQKDLLLVCCNV